MGSKATIHPAFARKTIISGEQLYSESLEPLFLH